MPCHFFRSEKSRRIAHSRGPTFIPPSPKGNSPQLLIIGWFWGGSKLLLLSDILKEDPSIVDLYHLESRWRNSHVLVCHGPFLLGHLFGSGNRHLLSLQLVPERFLSGKNFQWEPWRFSEGKKWSPNKLRLLGIGFVYRSMNAPIFNGTWAGLNKKTVPWILGK